MDGLDEDDADHPPTCHRQKSHIRSYSPPEFPRTHRRSPSESDGSERKFDEDEDSGDSEESIHSASSADSRGKRRKLDRYAHGFKFAPRKPPAPSPAKTTTTNSSKNSEWSEDSTFILLDAWGELFLQNGRKSLHSDQWSAVAEKVNCDPRTVRSDSQCRNRLDTLNKKYKKEKNRVTLYPDLKSNWIYFTKMDSLMSLPSGSSPAGTAVEEPPVQLPCGVDAGEYVLSSSGVYTSRANRMDEMGDSPGDTESSSSSEEEDDSDGLLPPMSPMRRKDSSTLLVLADSIRKFGDIYERVEISKRKQMAEIERMRNDFQRDLEVQNRQILERAHAKIARMRHVGGEVKHEREEEKTDNKDTNGGVGGVDGDDDNDIDESTENLSD